MPDGKRSILPFVVLFFAIIIVFIAIFYFMGNWQNTQTLNEDQKLKAKAMALNDSVVQGRIYQIQNKYYSQDGWKFNMSNPVFYTIDNVTMGKVHEISPGVNRTRYLPAVELVFGHGDLSDINLYAYVDLEKERVSYIGFTGRSGPTAAGYYYTSGYDGVVEHIENTGWLKEYKNVTIVDTAYSGNSQLTDTEKSRLLTTAMRNETVKSFLNETAGNGGTCEYSYSITSDESDTAGHHYIIAHPNIHVSVKEPGGSTGLKYLDIKFDGISSTVTSADIGKIFMPIPDQYPPVNMPPSG